MGWLSEGFFIQCVACEWPVSPTASLWVMQTLRSHPRHKPCDKISRWLRCTVTSRSSAPWLHPSSLSLILVSPLGKSDGKMLSLLPLCYSILWTCLEPSRVFWIFFPSRINKACLPPDQQCSVPDNSEQNDAWNTDSWNMNAQVYSPESPKVWKSLTLCFGGRSDLTSVYFACPISAQLYPNSPHSFKVSFF